MDNSDALSNTNFRQKTPKKTFAKFFFITFLIVLIIGVGSLAVVSSLLDKQIFNETSSSPGQSGLLIPPEGMFVTDQDFKDSKRINILILGETKEELSDTIMVASFDKETKKADVISVPRDTYHPREGYTDPGTKKINAAYWGDHVSSAEAVHEVLQGMPIHYYAIATYEGIENIVDAMGGVEVDVPFDMNYTKNSENPPLVINLKAGKQTLNGKDAVGFIRYRSGYRDGDYGRIEAQQQFVKSAIKKSMGLNLPKVAGTVVDNIESDVTLRQVLSIASDASDMSSSSIDTYTLPGNSNMYEGLSFFFSDKDQTEEMLRAIYTGGDFEATETYMTEPQEETSDESSDDESYGSESGESSSY